MIHTMEQGSPSWFELRSRLVTATDFSSIAHRAKIIRYPYAKAKVETHIKSKVTHTLQNAAMAKGQAYEPIIMAELLKENPILDNLIMQVNNNMASYDAVDVFDGVIREIKTSSTTLDKIQLLIPGYVAQVIHQAYVLHSHLEGNIPLIDMDCKIVLLQFLPDESTTWHIIDITMDELVHYECATLQLNSNININIELWHELCNEFHKELIKHHNNIS